MKFNKLIQTSVAIGLLAFAGSSFAVPMALDIGAVDANLSNDSFMYSDSDSMTTIFDSMTLYNTHGIDPLLTSDTGTVGGFAANATLGNQLDTEDYLQNWVLKYDYSWDGTSGLLNLNLDTTVGSFTPVAVITLTSFNTNDPNPGGFFKGYISEVTLDNFFVIDGVAITSFSEDINSPILLEDRIVMSFDASNTSIDASVVPEPSIIALFGLGLVGLGMVGRRSQKK